MPEDLSRATSWLYHTSKSYHRYDLLWRSLRCAWGRWRAGAFHAGGCEARGRVRWAARLGRGAREANVVLVFTGTLVVTSVVYLVGGKHMTVSVHTPFRRHPKATQHPQHPKPFPASVKVRVVAMMGMKEKTSGWPTSFRRISW